MKTAEEILALSRGELALEVASLQARLARGGNRRRAEFTIARVGLSVAARQTRVAMAKSALRGDPSAAAAYLDTIAEDLGIE